MSFFFPLTTAYRVLELNRKLYASARKTWGYSNLPTENPEIEGAIVLFNYEIQRFLGFGFFCSFIWGTNAYNARIILDENVNKIIPKIQENINYIPNGNSDGTIFLFKKWAM